MSNPFEKKLPTSSSNPEGETGERPLSAEHATKLLYKSFYFSQGFERLQYLIFAWLHEARPHYSLNAEQQEAMQKQFEVIAT